MKRSIEVLLNKVKGWRHYLLSFAVALTLCFVTLAAFFAKRLAYYQIAVEHLDDVLYGLAAIIAAAKGASYLENKSKTDPNRKG